MSRYIDAYAIKYFVSVTNDGCFYRVAFKDEIDKIPTADVVPMKFHERCMELEIKKRANMVERKQGKNISEDGFLCSVCTFGDFGGFHGYEPNFCPNCGAEMDGERKILPKD